MTADRVVRFTTLGVAARIYEIQGAAHISPLAGKVVSGVPGVVTSVRPNSFTMQDATGDGSAATSDAILVFANGIGGSVSVGQAVTVSGRVTEFRPGGATSANLTTTEITSPAVTPGGAGRGDRADRDRRRRPRPADERDRRRRRRATSRRAAPTIRRPTGSTSGRASRRCCFACRIPSSSGPRTASARSGCSRTTAPGRASGPHGRASSSGRRTSTRSGFSSRTTSSPGATPAANVGDHFTTSAVGVLDYNFGNYELQLTSALTRVDGGLAREVTRPQLSTELTVASFNVENLSPVDPPAKFARLAGLIVDNLRSPDIVAVQEIQDNDGPGEHGRHGRDADLPAARRGDPGRGRAGVRVPSDRPGGRRGRRPARRATSASACCSAPTAGSPSSTGRARPRRRRTP